MGRVLNYSIRKEIGGFTAKEKNIIIEISHKYNSGQFEKVWSCENFWLDPYNYYPNWKGLKKKGIHTGEWELINKRAEELQIEGLNHAQTAIKLKKEGLVLFHENPNSNVIRGFTKIQGNEFNGMLIYIALIELSTKIKNMVISLSDEGELLYCPVKIRNGKARPDISEVANDIQWYYTLIGENDKSISSELKTLDLPEQIIKDLKVGKEGNGYDRESVIGYINNKIRNVDELYKRIKKNFEKDGSAPFIYNIQQYYFAPELLCRPVNPNDFYGMEMTSATLMAGFHGEYWKLSDMDSEAESYRMIGMVQKMFGQDNAKNPQILGEKK